MVVTLLVSQFSGWLKDVAPVNMFCIVTTFDVTHGMGRLNAVAFQNVPNMLVTFDVFHVPTEPLKLAVSENVPCMFVTPDVSHVLRLCAKAVAPLKVF